MLPTSKNIIFISYNNYNIISDYQTKQYIHNHNLFRGYKELNNKKVCNAVASRNGFSIKKQSAFTKHTLLKGKSFKCGL